MSHMHPQVYHGQAWIVETTNGTEIVPVDVCERGSREALADYLEGEQTAKASKRTGYLARMSAPGFMDATDWTLHATWGAAHDYLAETYGNDEAPNAGEPCEDDAGEICPVWEAAHHANGRSVAAKNDGGRYKIVRSYMDRHGNTTRRTIATRLTLTQARAHCNDPATHGTDRNGRRFFDGYTAM